MALSASDIRSLSPTWVIMPILANRAYTITAIADCLAQSVQTRLLLINQGVDDAFRDELEKIAEAYEDRILLWSHQPPLPSLAATWNRALDFVWEAGGTEVLVVNNDVRLHRETVEQLSNVLHHFTTQALFVSAVGVTPEQFDPTAGVVLCDDPDAEHPVLSKGGPDFSCFLISRECHHLAYAAYRFDEHFTPAFCEDLDFHRTLLLAGEGARIFSVNLPFLHYGSATLKTVKDRAPIDRAIEAGSRTYYKQKWGGPVNEERYLRARPLGTERLSALQLDDLCAAKDDGTATTPYLQAHPPNTDPLSGTIAPTMDAPIEANFIYPEAPGAPPIADLTRKMLSLSDVGITPRRD